MQRTDGNGIGGAEQAVDAGVTLQKLLRLLVAGLHVEPRHADPLGARYQPGVPQCGLEPGPAGLADGLVQHGGPQKPRCAAAFFQHMRSGGAGCTEIVVIHAGIAAVLLAQNDDRDFQAVQYGLVLRRKEGGDEDNAVHGVVPQRVQRFDLALVLVGCVDQQQLVALFVQHAADALHHAGAALTAELGHNDADLPGTAGAHHLRLHTGAVAGLGHGLFNGCALVGAQVAVVEIPAYRRLGYPRIGRKFRDIHIGCPQ